MIPLHKPYISGDELAYVTDAIESGELSGNGKYTNLCQGYFRENYGFNTCLLTTSCTTALEMAALLSEVGPGDEVIIPSFTFVSSVNPFIMRGATIVFADSEEQTPNIDPASISRLITNKTKAIIVVHYAGIACDMEAILKIANEHQILVIEDAAHAQGAKHNEAHLGSLGALGTYSFHPTKNITSGEGGLLIVNNEKFQHRAELLWEKGTNRKNFLMGEVNKYEWHDIGSSFYPSELNAAFLWGQLRNTDKVNDRRMKLWNIYAEELNHIPGIQIPNIPDFAHHNAHLFYLKTANNTLRNKLISELRKQGISAAFHYLALHESPFWKTKGSSKLSEAMIWQDCIIRLPLFYSMTEDELNLVITSVRKIMEG